MKKALFIAVQAAIIFALSVAAFLLKPLPALHSVAIWAILPLISAVSAFILVKNGVNPYLSWISPPLSVTLGALIASMGYLPPGGCMLLSALTALIGSAAGSEYLKRKHKRRKGKQ